MVLAVLVPVIVMLPEELPTELPVMSTPRLALDPDAAPVKEIGPVTLDTSPGASRKIPCEAPEEVPPVPLRVIAPLPVVLSVPPLTRIPWQVPAVPEAVAVIEIVFPPLAPKLNPDAKPIPPFPWPSIEEVAVTLPAAVKAAPMLMPLPPVVALLPPMQFENVTAPPVVKATRNWTP